MGNVYDALSLDEAILQARDLRQEAVRLAAESKVALFEGDGRRAQELLSKGDSLRRTANSLERRIGLAKKPTGLMDLGLAG